jgi:glucokinase
MYIGVDLGGTNIAAGVVDENGKILSQGSTPTLSERHYSEIVKDMADLCKKVTEEAGLSISEIQAIGIGSPGSIDNKNGVVVYANNIKMDNTPIAAELQKYINVPVNVENDANAAAFGEYVINGGGVNDFIFITLGTGVGGGVIINKKIYRGFNGAAGELGHTTLVHNGELCTCGNKGCWEAYASVTALIRQTEEEMKKSPESLMHKVAEKEGKVSGRTAFEAAKQGDEAAKRVVDQYITYVADGITGVINIFQPEKLVIGGGISKEGDYLLRPIIQHVEKYGYNKYMKKTEISIATLFNEAGIIGAALAAKK